MLHSKLNTFVRNGTLISNLRGADCLKLVSFQNQNISDIGIVTFFSFEANKHKSSEVHFFGCVDYANIFYFILRTILLHTLLEAIITVIYYTVNRQRIN